jgi:transcriptional regulator with XRE-family HTH domain
MSALSQSDVAQRLGWSMSKMQRIEAGEVTVSATDLRALLDLYGGFSDEETKQLTEDARVSRRERWWTAPEYRQHLTSGLMQLLQFEAEATAIRAYQPVVVPGVLQTAEFADYILGWWNKSLSEGDRRIRYDVRMLRRQQVIEREDAPDYRLVLDESVLVRNIGGRKIMAGQLEALAEAAERPNVYVRVVPFDTGGLLGLLGPFVLIDLDEEDEEDAVLYRESWNSDEIIHDAKDVNEHRGYFETLWEQSLPEDASLRLINAQAGLLRSALDRAET